MASCAGLRSGRSTGSEPRHLEVEAQVGFQKAPRPRGEPRPVRSGESLVQLVQHREVHVDHSLGEHSDMAVVRLEAVGLEQGVLDLAQCLVAVDLGLDAGLVEGFAALVAELGCPLPCGPTLTNA